MHNLVAHADRSAIRERHVNECAALAEALPLLSGERWLDLGTGGGLPGLVLAILAPDVPWTLLDATAKKVEAVAGFARQLRLDNVDVVAARAETLARDPVYRQRYAGVISRAVAPLATAAELSRGFVRPSGMVAAVKGPAWAEDLAQARRALRLLGLEAVHSQRVESGVRHTWLVTMRAAGPVPQWIPRRDGVPRLDPL